jgi:hypothetical protein
MHRPEFSLKSERAIVLLSCKTIKDFPAHDKDRYYCKPKQA